MQKLAHAVGAASTPRGGFLSRKNRISRYTEPMLPEEIFLKMKQKYGDVGSWAIWKDAEATPKSNMDAGGLFDLKTNPKFLDELHANSVLVGLNFSRTAHGSSESFTNFHDPRSSSQDYKLRFALKDTPLWGSYMTDVFKHEVEVDSNEILKRISSNEIDIKSHLIFLEQEISDLESTSKPVIYAFGGSTYKFLESNLPKNIYSKLIKLTHYAHYISKEKYRESIKDALID
jgi:hypothetical protein